jgi:nucleotide-binding universal stress UspA family protein
MTEMNHPVLVPWDFSQVADYALQHAIKFGKLSNHEVILVHVVKKQKEISEATKKMEAYAEEVNNKYDFKPSIVVKEGSIFTAINDVIDEKHAIMAIMGTHGMKGMQKFTGSWALKVITGSKAPFVVVQAPPTDEQFTDIVFPVDFRTEDKEKLVWANFLSRYYSSKIHLCQLKVTDPRIKKKTQANFVYSKKYLTDKGIDYDIITLDGGGNLAEESIKYAQRINAGLILIMTTKNIRFQDYVLGASEQQIIANEAKIPVMCVNPRMDLRKFAGFGG